MRVLDMKNKRTAKNEQKQLCTELRATSYELLQRLSSYVSETKYNEQSSIISVDIEETETRKHIHNGKLN